MIEIVNGNILECSEDIIAHQTNCLGIMGGGVALYIRRKYPEVYEEYNKFCKQYYKKPSQLLGYTEFVETGDGKIIANCFGQCDIGSGVQTNYDALKMALIQVRSYAERHNMSVAIPYKIGCGLAGGDWNIVSGIIENIFDKSNIHCVLYSYQG